MNLYQIIGELRAELAAVNEALAVLDKLARSQGKRRGRPPMMLLEEFQNGGPVRKRRRFSDETRRKMAIAQRKRWANARKQKSA